MNARLQAKFDRIQQQKAALLADISGKSAQLLNAQPREGAWSVLQTIKHLMLVEAASLAYMKKKLAYHDQRPLPAAGVSAFFRSLALTAYVRVPLKAKAPRPVAVQEAPTTFEVQQLLGEWDHLRQELKTFAETYPEELLGHCVYKHPMAGRLTLGQALSFMHGHAQRHRGQIQRTLQALEA